MRKKWLLAFIIFWACFIIAQPSYAFFGKKDYKKTFLERAKDAEKRQDSKSAFFIYEKAKYYYKEDKQVLEAYAAFCERGKYYDKAAALYQELYNLVNDEYYLFKKYSNQIKQADFSRSNINIILQDKKLSQKHKKELEKSIIAYFSKKKDWKSVKKHCDKIPKKQLSKDDIALCIQASEKLSDEKAAYGYYLRYNELFPRDVEMIKKILAIAEKKHDVKTQEEFLKKFSALNPKDKGIRYRLAGFYESQKQWAEANNVYEQLIAQGDKSKHVMSSSAFVKKQLNAPSSSAQSTVAKEQHPPKKLSAQELKEMQMYQAMEAKNFKKAADFLDEFLKKTPKSTKFLRLRVDMALEQKKYPDAIVFFEKLQKIKPLSSEDEKLLAFLYSQTEKSEKSLDIIEKMLKNNPESKDLMQLALQYSMTSKDWDKAIFYTDKLLVMMPSDEKLLKNRGDLYSIKKDFASALKSYQKLMLEYPKDEYQLTLVNLYMAVQDFESAQKFIETLYVKNPENPELVETYLNVLLAQNKLPDAAYIVRKHHLENTKTGASVLGDLAMMQEDYTRAKCYYDRALELDKKDSKIKNKLAFSYKKMEKFDASAKTYCDVLANDPNNLEAMLGLGALEIDKKNYKKPEVFLIIFCL